MRTTICAAILVALVGITGCQLPYAGGARPVTPAQLDATWLRAVPTPVVRQKQESDCGLAALAMVAGAWGHTWSVDELAHRLPPTANGVKLGALRDLARQRGLQAFSLRASTEDVRHELASGRPVVLGLMLPYDNDRNRAHYEVAVAMNPKDGTIVTIDPATGEWMRRSRAVLDVEWKAAGYAALVVTGEHAPAEAISRSTP